MSDKTLVERLREEAANRDPSGPGMHVAIQPLLREAADRIEALERAGLDYNSGLADGERGSRARIAALEEALRDGGPLFNALDFLTGWTRPLTDSEKIHFAIEELNKLVVLADADKSTALGPSAGFDRHFIIATQMSARYKVSAPNDSVYRDLLSLLQGRVQLFVTSQRRRFLSTGELPESVRTAIRSRGGEITEDYQYSLDRERLE